MGRFAGSVSERFAETVLLLLALAVPLSAQDSIAVRATTPASLWLLYGGATLTPSTVV
jgi:hypothetical protein